MSDWLSKVEKNSKIARNYVELEAGRRYSETPIERMARVLREAVSYANFLEFMIEDDERPRSRIRMTWEIKDDLLELLKAEDEHVQFDDTKELLDEKLLKPRSSYSKEVWIEYAKELEAEIKNWIQINAENTELMEAIASKVEELEVTLDSCNRLLDHYAAVLGDYGYWEESGSSAEVVSPPP